MSGLRIRAQRALFALAVPAGCLLSSPLPAGAQTRFYASMLGTDTTSLERFERRGSTITGVWVTYHPGGGRGGRDILRHEYTIGLTAEGRPSSMHLLLRRPGGPVVGTYDARFTDDSVVIAESDDSVPHRIAARRAFPVLGRSMVMVELIVAGASKGRQTPDSGTVVVVPVTGPFDAQTILIARPSAGTVVLGRAGAPPFLLGPGGEVDSIVMSDGRVPLRHVPAFDIDAIALAAAKGK